jgi:hypothetical protein
LIFFLFLKLRNIQALLEAEAEAKFNLQTKITTSLEHLNCLVGNTSFTSNNSSDLENINPSHFTGTNVLSSFNFLEMCGVAAITPTAAADARDTLAMRNVSQKMNEMDEEDENEKEDKDDDETNSMVLETCLLKVFDEILVEDSRPRSQQPLKKREVPVQHFQVLKALNISNLENIKCGGTIATNGRAGASGRAVESAIDNNNNKNNTMHYNSLSSSCSSPISQKDDKSPKVSSTQQSASVRFVRSKYTSNSIYLQPTDVTEPLSEGEYNEYKLFPNDSVASHSQVSVSRVVEYTEESNNVFDKLLGNIGLVNKITGLYTTNEDEIEIYSPPLSSCLSSVSSCSNSSSATNSPMSNSPVHHDTQAFSFFLK